MIRTIEWKDDGVYIIDQTILPDELKTIRCEDYERIAKAIEGMEIRGAPAIGVAAAMGIALAAKNCINERELKEQLVKAYNRLKSTRPTARNLFWALERMRKVWEGSLDKSSAALKERVINEALQIAEEDVAVCRSIGKNGSALISDGDGILTHCNAGALACVEHGTALGIMRTAFKEGKKFLVYSSETRPLLQGARLTAFELKHEKIPFKMITDNMAAYVMEKGFVNKVIVGADLITRYGDVFNKIGTYGLAVLAKHHKIPFYVAAPLSTIDLNARPGTVTIEERAQSEVTHIRGVRITPDGTEVINPAFDLTPGELVAAIITEKGVICPPYDLSLLFRQGND